jgi:hypothetical protein
MQSNYIHPIIELINNNASDETIVSNLEIYCGKQLVYIEDDVPFYDIVDQFEFSNSVSLLFSNSVSLLFSYCVENSRPKSIKWLCDNFIPLRVRKIIIVIII